MSCLAEAIQRLHTNSLPERAVAITIDDGFHDAYSVAYPLLESFGYSATLYLTTYYVGFNRPVFDPMCSYLLWKGRVKKQLHWPGVFSAPVSLDAAGRDEATAFLKRFAIANQLSGLEKDQLLQDLAGRLAVDYRQLCRDRVLHLITADEARDLAARGADLQYHTHRHRACRSRQCMLTELNDNRSELRHLTPTEPKHFCYTYGFHAPEHLAYLREYGMVSATTCEPGLCTTQTDPLLLPRLVDTPAVSDLEFRSWLAGTADLLPRRRAETTEALHLDTCHTGLTPTWDVRV